MSGGQSLWAKCFTEVSKYMAVYEVRMHVDCLHQSSSLHLRWSSRKKAGVGGNELAWTHAANRIS